MSEPKHGFLHIGKTGGTTIRNAIRMAKRHSDGTIKFFGHNVQLKKLFQNTDISISFVVRDPIERFVSGFNSRLRNGRPLHNIPWQPNEAISFLFFPTANDLAEGLEGGDERTTSAAMFATKAINHLRRNLTFHLISPEFLDEHKERIYFVCDTSSIDDNLRNILAPLGLDDSAPQPMTKRLHVNPNKSLAALSESAREKLRRHLADEYEIYEYCKNNLFRLNL